MARRTVHVCQACGYQTAKWLGQCPDCRAWGSIVEEPAAGSAAPRGLSGGARPARLREITADETARERTGIGELDRVLGGGLVPGSLVLLGGDPGIGKSTLLLAALDGLAAAGSVLYVSGEESARQTKLRAERLGVRSPGLHVLCETDAERILAAAGELSPRALAVDSIQTLHLPDVPSAPGSVTQVREVTARLLQFAKGREVAVFLVGHVTKDGAIAGPRVLEHLVDTVLYFEADRGHAYRILRAHKNRFGSVAEIGVFEMRGAGLVEVPDPSGLFLAERPLGVSGSAVVAALQGSRPVLYELQALCAPAAYGTARRTSLGIDGARVALLAAVLEKKAAVDLALCDVFVNVAGGAEIDEPAADLAVVAALASSARDRPLDPNTVVLGEVGLAGEIRAVGQPELRLREAQRLGFRRAVLPRANAERCRDVPIEQVPVSDVVSALQALLG